MFPKEVSGAGTVWVPYTDKLTGDQINVTCVLQGCFWNDDSISVFQRTGVQTANSVTLFVPYAKEVTGKQYISPDGWSNLSYDELKGFWTVNPMQMPLVAKGALDFEFEWAAPNAPNRIAVQESNLQIANPNVRRAKDVNENLFGSAEMWHILIRA